MKSTFSFILLSIMMAGCSSVPPHDVSAFSEAAKQATVEVESVIQEFNSASVDNELVKLAQRHQLVTTSNFDAIQEKILKTDSEKDLALFRANQALAQYGDALGKLATAGNAYDLDAASIALFDGLQGANQSYKSLKKTDDVLVSEATNASIAQTFAAIGNSVTEYKRQKALKHIVIQSNSHIQEISNVIVDEFNQGVIAKRLKTIKHTEMTGLIRDFNKRSEKMNYHQRRKSLNKIYHVYTAMLNVDESIKASSEAIDNIRKAHQELTNLASQNALSSHSLKQQLSLVREAVEKSKSLRQSLTTSE